MHEQGAAAPVATAAIVRIGDGDGAVDRDGIGTDRIGRDGAAASAPVDRLVVSPVAETVNVAVCCVPTLPSCAVGVNTMADRAALASAAEAKSLV